MNESAVIMLILLVLGVPIALLAIALINVVSLSRRVRALEAVIKPRPGPLPGILPARPATGRGPAAPVPMNGPGAPVPAPPPPVPPGTPPGPAPARPSRTKEEWESLIGGKVLNRVGALALIIGIGFFLKYAFDNHWLTETMRVLLGGAIGGLLLWFGRRTHRRGFQIFSQGLVGAGIAVLYLSAYASFNFYHLVPQGAAYLLMSAVTVTALWQAFSYDSLAVSMLAWAGGFLTPLMLRTGQTSDALLFAYYTALNAGLLLVVLRRAAWLALQPLSLLATAFSYIVWHQQCYGTGTFGLALSFLAVWWLLFFAAARWQDVRGPSGSSRLRRFSDGLNAVFFYWGLYAIIDPGHHRWMGLVTLGLGLTYVAAAALARRFRKADGSFRQSIVTAIVLAALATTTQFKGFTAVTLWSLEAVVLVWCGRRWDAGYVWKTALLLLAAVFIRLPLTEGAFRFWRDPCYHPVVNHRLLAFGAAAVSLLCSGRWIRQIPRPGSGRAAAALFWGGCVLAFVAPTVEITDVFARAGSTLSGDPAHHLAYLTAISLSLSWIGYSLLTVQHGSTDEARSFVVCGILALAAGAGTVFVAGFRFVPTAGFVPIVNLRFAGLVLATGGCAALLRVLRPLAADRRWAARLMNGVRVAIVALVFSLLTGETADFFRRLLLPDSAGMPQDPPGHPVQQLRYLAQLSRSLVWLLYSIALLALGLLRRMRWMRVASIALFGLTILKIFIFDLSSLTTGYRVFSFLGLGAILLAVSYLYQRYKDVIFGGGPSR